MSKPTKSARPTVVHGSFSFGLDPAFRLPTLQSDSWFKDIVDANDETRNAFVEKKFEGLKGSVTASLGLTLLLPAKRSIDVAKLIGDPHGIFSDLSHWHWSSESRHCKRLP